MKQLITILLTLTIGFAQSLSKEEKQIRSYIDTHTYEAIHLVEKVVNINSGTLNIKGNKKVGKSLRLNWINWDLKPIGLPTLKISNGPDIYLQKCAVEKDKIYSLLAIWTRCLNRITHSKNILEKAILHTVPVFRI